MDPQVIHLIMCDGAHHDPRNLHRLQVRGLQLRLHARQPPPLQHSFLAIAMMVGFFGAGELWLQVFEQVTDLRVFRSQRHAVRFPRNLDEVFGFRLRIDSCPLPRYGRYRLELLLDDEAIATRPFWLLPRT
jgi:hypothetical protein